MNYREWFPLQLEEVWKIFTWEWLLTSTLTGARAHTFLLMSNHYHLEVTTPEAPLSDIMEMFQKSVARSVNEAIGRKGHLFGGRYHSSLVESPGHYANLMKYIYRNPVKAGICERVEDYPFGALSGRIGNGHLPFPLYRPYEGVDDILIPDSTDELLLWLNTPFKKEDEEAIRRGIRRRTFSPGLSKTRVRPSHLKERLV